MSPAVKSAARAIEILNYFASVREPQPLKSICDALGYPQSSMTVILKTMMNMGYLNFNRTQRVYFPTTKVTSLGDWIPVALFGQGKALEVMKDLHYATKETVVLTTQNDIYIQYVSIIESSHALRFHVPEGALRLITSSAIGWLLMSKLKDRDIDTLIRRANIADGKPAAADMNTILGHVKLARERGYSYGENTPFLGGATLCVTLPTMVQGQPVAIGCGGIVERMRQNFPAYLALLQKASQSL